MTPDEIRTTIDAAIGSKVLLTYPQLILFVLLSGVAAYLGAYLMKKGEYLATHEDIECLTKKIEDIKSDYARQIEDYRQELSRRSQAARVAELLVAAFDPATKPMRFNQLVVRRHSLDQSHAAATLPLECAICLIRSTQR